MPKVVTSGSSGHGGGGRRRRPKVSTALSEINVVPLVDVMLVLLIIFMVAAPMMQQGFPVQLPESRESKAISAPVTVTVPLSFRRDQRVEIDGKSVSFEFLPEVIRQALDTRTEKSVVLAGDGSILYEELIAVFDRLKTGGVDNVSMQTQPAPPRAR